MSILPNLFGGRPMRMIEVRFIDQVSGKPVCLYEDRIGRRWLSDGAWGASRIKPSNPLAMYERRKPMNANKQDAGGEVTNPDNVGGLLPCPGCGKSDLDHCPADFVAVNGLTRGMIVRCAWCHFAAPEAAWNRRELCRAAPAGGDDLRLLVKELRESLEGVVRVADRQTDEFDRAREAIARAAHVFVNAGDSEAQFIADSRDLNCPACGGSGHVDDSAPAGSGEVHPIPQELFDRAHRLRELAAANRLNECLPTIETICGKNAGDAIRDAAALLRKLQQGADGEARDGRRWRAVRDSQALEDDAIRLTTWSPHLQEPLYPSPVMADRLADELIASQGQEGGHG